MTKFLKILILASLIISSFWVNLDSSLNTLSYNTNITYADNYNATSKDSWTERNNKLGSFFDWNFFSSAEKWSKWIYDTIIQWAKDLKNLFFAIAILFYLIIVIKVLISENAEEEWNKFKKWVMWVTIWIIVMQTWVAIMTTLYDKQQMWWTLAWLFIKNIITPLIWLLQVMASVFFLVIAFLAFYQLATANWNEEQAKSWKMSILYAIMWYIVVYFTNVIVESTYGKLSWWAISNPDESKIASRILDIITWINWFVWLIVIIMIIYAWFQILTSNWDEEKIKKSKKSIIYIIIWIFILIANYLILTFFLWANI
jgi:hypothetical protein